MPAQIVVSGLAHVATLAFTIVFSFFLLALVDWHEVSRCRDEHSCSRGLGRYLRTSRFLAEDGQRGRDALCATYLTVFGVYWIWSCLATVNSLREAYEMSKFYAMELGLGEREVRSVRWNGVVTRLAELQRTGRAPWRAFQTAAAVRRRHRDSEAAREEEDVISAHDVAIRIMRKDNYLVAMLNAGILALELPLPSRLVGRYRLLDALCGRLRLTKTLEWSLQACILDYRLGRSGGYFRSQGLTRSALTDDAASLRQRFVTAGVAHVVLMPFVAAFMSMRFFMMHAPEWRENKRYLGPRQWSPVARWAFRELNELPHVFEARLAASEPHADAYLKMFPRPVLAAASRCIAFAAGAVVATLVALAAVLEGGDALLLNVHFGDRPLLWYVGAFSAILALARSFDDTEAHKYYNDADYDAAMVKVAEHTHCFPDEWRGKCHSVDVADAFRRAFRYKVWLFIDEIASVVFAPLVLCFSLPRCAEDVIRFINENTVDVDGFGQLLGQSLFDFDRYGDPRYGGAPQGSTTQPTVSGKMEKSYLNFKLAYPEWDLDDAHDFVNAVAGMLAPDSGDNSDRDPPDRPSSPDQLSLSFERLDAFASTHFPAEDRAHHAQHADNVRHRRSVEMSIEFV